MCNTFYEFVASHCADGGIKMSQNANDRRVKMTHQLLKSSLIELMKEKSLHEISIKSICENADVNRTTFYRYYNSQYDLYDEILSDISSEVRSRIHPKTEENALLLTLTDILTYAEENRELFMVILSRNGSLVIGEMFTRNVSSHIDPDSTSELAMYCTQFISAGLANIVWTWLGKEKRRSAREVAMLVNALLIHGVNKAVMFSNKPENKN